MDGDVRECQGKEIELSCGYRPSLIRETDVTLSDISDNTPVPLELKQSEDVGFYALLSHTLLSSEATGDKRYRCAVTSGSHSVEVAISFIEPTGKDKECMMLVEVTTIMWYLFHLAGQ